MVQEDDTAGGSGVSRARPRAQKSLFAAPAGRAGQDNLRRIVARFGHESFDFLLCVYDNSRYDGDGFAGCTVRHDPAPLFWVLKEHLTPALCRRYEYVFIWMDDLHVLDFDPARFLGILRTHHIEVAQPALSADSIIYHPVTARQDTPIGRYTDFVEEMAFVFRGDLWERFWRLIAPDRNPWGWGYDEIAYSACRFRRMAVIDAHVIRHTRRGSYHEAARAGQKEVHERYRRFFFPRKRTICPISDGILHRTLIAPLRLNLYFAWASLHAWPGLARLRSLLRAGRHKRAACASGKRP